jgi:hypothetical protein
MEGRARGLRTEPRCSSRVPAGGADANGQGPCPARMAPCCRCCRRQLPPCCSASAPPSPRSWLARSHRGASPGSSTSGRAASSPSCASAAVGAPTSGRPCRRPTAGGSQGWSSPAASSPRRFSCGASPAHRQRRLRSCSTPRSSSPRSSRPPYSVSTSARGSSEPRGSWRWVEWPSSGAGADRRSRRPRLRRSSPAVCGVSTTTSPAASRKPTRSRWSR